MNTDVGIQNSVTRQRNGVVKGGSEEAAALLSPKNSEAALLSPKNSEAALLSPKNSEAAHLRPKTPTYVPPTPSSRNTVLDSRPNLETDF